VTDRAELDDQPYGEFKDAGVVEGHVQATSSAHLRQLLREEHRYVFTLIHKFRPEAGQEMPVCSERDDVIVITDEAHRSQYSTLALNMRRALPNAGFIGFTGTPLITEELERTREVFGDYVSTYNFRDSIDDGATVPLYYENRIPELQIINERFDEELSEILEQAELDDSQERALARRFATEYQLITRPERLRRLAADLVRHFVGRGFLGKAMYVGIDKATAVRMYELVMVEWQKHLAELRERAARVPALERDGLQQQIAFMAETEMAVVVSQSQNEIADPSRTRARHRPSPPPDARRGPRRALQGPRRPPRPASRSPRQVPPRARVIWTSGLCGSCSARAALLGDVCVGSSDNQSASQERDERVLGACGVRVRLVGLVRSLERATGSSPYRKAGSLGSLRLQVMGRRLRG
jgi:hypothetical protein